VLPDQDGGVAADSFPASVVPHWHVIRTAGRCTGSAINARIPAHSEFASWVHRTALCVEARDQQMLGAPTTSA